MGSDSRPTCVELCAGAGGMALGMERAGWRHLMLVERDIDAARTLKLNNPDWPVVCADLADVDASRIGGCDMVCGGPPCQPFSVAGRRMGEADPRDAFMPSLMLAMSLRPGVILFENVLGLTFAKHAAYRASLVRAAEGAGYAARWITIDCSRWGVPQSRRRVILAAARVPPLTGWPALPPAIPRPSLYNVLVRSGMPPEMVPPQLGRVTVVPTITCGGPGSGRSHGVGKGSLDNGSNSSRDWRRLGIHSGSISDGPVAPTVMGGGGRGAGSYCGGPKQKRDWADIGIDARSATSGPLAPTVLGGGDGHGAFNGGPGQRRQWAEMGIDARSAEPSEPSRNGPEGRTGGDAGLVRLSMRNVAAIQGFPPEYEFVGTKRSVYQQVGNALPAPAAEQLGRWAMRLLNICVPA